MKRGDELYGVIKTCDICGITSDKKRIKYVSKANKNLCDKHAQQFRYHGEFLDSNPQSINDPNGYEICGDYTNVYTYDRQGNIKETFVIDTDDLEKVLKHKWRVAYKRRKPYIVTGNNRSFPITYLTRYLLDYSGDLEIDHIDGNVLNNRKDNLRYADKTVQCGNLAPKMNSKIGIRGVSYATKDKVYRVDFSYNKKRLRVKNFKDINEAVYARYMLELIINPYRYTQNDENIMSYIDCLTSKQKDDIETYVCILALDNNMLVTHKVKEAPNYVPTTTP